MEDRLQFRQRFERRVGARAFVGIEGEALRRGLRLDDLDVERDDAVVGEAPRLLRFDRPVVAAVRECVGVLARDVVLSRDVLRGQAHVEVDVGTVLDEVRIGTEAAVAADETHRLGAAGDDGVGHPGHDPLGGHGDGLRARRAEAVDGDGGDGVGDAGAEGGDAGDVVPRLPFRRGAADDDVVERCRLDVRIGLQQRAHDRGGHVVGTRGTQRAARRFADRRAQGGDDHCFIHLCLPWCRERGCR